MGQFNPDFYQRYRPEYPADLFVGLSQELEQRGFEAPFVVADIGCGAGHSTFSFLKTGIQARVIGIDLDPRMLEQALENAASFELQSGQTLNFHEGSGEQTGLQSHSLDLLLVGSAFHWMDPLLAREEFHRILKPQGLIRIFEYQFPKSLENPELNEWIRRQFNLHWKAPGQIPRGSLSDLTSSFSSKFQLLSTRKVPRKIPMRLRLGPDELAGLIFSQSRVLHFEATLKSESELISFRDSVKTELEKLMQGRVEDFDFKLSYLDFSA
jgi:ubiquinone/menaquinone biosynthesis C-methylase UbiE